ncbi:MAG: IclR family transcriptional regulator [Caulobacteraceae bacterium]
MKTALRVLELIGEVGQAGVSDLARATGEPKSTVQRNLITLHEAGWIRPVEGGKRRRWTLSPRVLLLARRLQPVERLRSHALPVMERLRDHTQETIHLTLRDGNLVVLIERLDSPRTLRTVRQLGDAAPLHMNSTGKSILAHLPEADRAAYLTRRLGAPTPRTLADPAALARDLELIRQRGFAFNDGELDLEVRAVGAPIRLGTGEPVAAISISCPAARLPDSLVEAYGALVRDAAADISLRM